MNTRAQPAEERASFTLGTVKKRMITWGRPAVPIIRDMVYANMFRVLRRTSVVYCLKPRSTTMRSIRSSR